MKNIAILALCFFSSFATANDIEEVITKARRFEIVMVKLSESHKQSLNGDWYYVEKKEEKEQKEKA